MAETFRARLKRLVAESDRPEFEQASVRVIITSLVLAYLVWFVARRGDTLSAHIEGLSVLLGFFAFSCLLLLRVLFAARASVLRRFLAMMADNAIVTYFLMSAGDDGAVIVGVYLFIIFGYGFRYGRLYLLACQAMAVAGFAIVLTANPYWSRQIAVGVGFLIALMILPLYVGRFSQRLAEAKKRADEEKARRISAYDELLVAVLDGQRSMAECMESFNVGNDATARDKVRVANQKLLELISKHGAPEVRQ
jgi:two-component system sensor histidine kinase RpfC